MRKPERSPHETTEAGDQPAAFGDKEDVARLCKVSPRTVLEWVYQGKIPVVRMGHRLLRFDLDEVKAAIKSWSK